MSSDALNPTDLSRARRRCPALDAALVLLASLGIEPTVRHGKHYKVQWLYRGRTFTVLAPAAPRNDEHAIVMVRQDVRRQIKLGISV